MSGYEWAVRYAGGHERLWEECRRVLDAGGVACLCALTVTGRGDLEGRLQADVRRLEMRAQYRARLQDMGRGGRDETVSPWGRRGIV